jgi:hypothetical protein
MCRSTGWHIAGFCLLATASLQPAAAAGPETAEAARAVLEQHCARCHQAGKLENPPAKGGLGNVLDLDALVRREDVVTPSDPDASRLYQVMLARHRPLQVFFGPLPGPTATEIGAVRDWLSALPPRAETCAGKEPVTIAGQKADIAAWRKAFETDPAKPLRFISLANLHNLCRSDALLAAYRGAVSALLTRLTLRRNVALETVGDASVLLAFRPADLGLTAEAWDLRAGAGEDIPGVVAAENVAARALAASAPETATVASPIARAEAAAPASSLIDGLDPVDALAVEYTRPVALARAAAEMNIAKTDLRERLLKLSGDEGDTGRRLLQTSLSRPDWERLKARLTGRPPQPSSAATQPQTEPSKLRVALWTQSPDYKAGDLLTVYAQPSANCNLTVVAVETGGLATVLFPNDTTTDNQVLAGARVQIPPPSAPFQLRLDKPGRHGIVAICNAVAKRPQGIGHDFERQRFTVLGDWRTFLLETAQREADYQKTQDDLRRFRTGAGRAETLEEQLPVGTEDEARAALTLTVEP